MVYFDRLGEYSINIKHKRHQRFEQFQYNVTKNQLSNYEIQMIATLGGVLLGLALGLILKASSTEPWSLRDAMYVKFIGDLSVSN